MRDGNETIRINFRVTRNITPDLYDELIALAPGKDRTTRLLTLIVTGLNVERFQSLPTLMTEDRSETHKRMVESTKKEGANTEIDEPEVAGLAAFRFED